MKSEKKLLCPFDKKPCIENMCAVWSEERGVCSFASSGFADQQKSTLSQKKPIVTEKADGGSGKYRTLLFD